MPESYGRRTALVMAAIQGRLANPDFRLAKDNIQAVANLAVELADAIEARMSVEFIPEKPKEKKRGAPITGNLTCGCSLEVWNTACPVHLDYDQWATAELA